MATYNELFDLKNDAGWNNFLAKVVVSCTVKAEVIIGSVTPGANAIEWAKSTLANPQTAANSIVNFVIAANKGATTAQILSAGDAAVQSNVSTAVDVLYGV